MSEPAFLRHERERVDAALDAVSRELLEGLEPRLRPVIEYALSTAGKRLRPVLCVLGYGAARPGVAIPDGVYRLACALELVHTYSLVHDDLPCMDDDDLRRGRPTPHRVFGTRAATIAGAALLPLAMTLLEREGAALGLDPAVRRTLISELADAAGAVGMVGGQLLDLEGEGKRLTPEELEQVHRRKTGALLACALRIGAIAGGATPEILAALTEYGASIGLAFQIADDLLDLEGESDHLGKEAGRDMALGKSSYPAIYGADRSRVLAKRKIEQAKQAIAGDDFTALHELADYVIDRGR